MSLWTNAICEKCGFVLMHCQCKKIEDIIANAGFRNNKIWHSAQHGPGEFSSYFDYLFERRLQGKEDLEPKPEEVWEAMKMQLNFYQISLAKAAENFTKLENKFRDANTLISDLTKDAVEDKNKLLAEIESKNKKLGLE